MESNTTKKNNIQYENHSLILIKHLKTNVLTIYFNIISTKVPAYKLSYFVNCYDYFGHVWTVIAARDSLHRYTLKKKNKNERQNYNKKIVK